VRELGDARPGEVAADDRAAIGVDEHARPAAVARVVLDGADHDHVMGTGVFGGH
jgi:hypothetical protein